MTHDLSQVRKQSERRITMQRFIHWLLNYPTPAYNSMKESIWMHKKLRIWDRVRVRIARLLMGE